MTDPSRLLDAAADDFERALLGSALADRGSDAARMRAMAALGSLGAGLLTSSSATASLATAPTSFAVSPKLTLAALAKWVGTGVAVGLISAGGVQTLVGSAQAPSTPTSAVTVPTASGSGVVQAPVRSEEPTLRAVAPSAPPSVREKSKPLAEAEPDLPGTRAVSSSNAAFPASEVGGAGLGEELQALERVRQALRSGDAAGSIAALAQYEARFPRGALAREATLLAVEAKLAAGDVAGARAVAARVLSADQASPHAKKVQALLSARGIQ